MSGQTIKPYIVDQWAYANGEPKPESVRPRGRRFRVFKWRNGPSVRVDTRDEADAQRAIWQAESNAEPRTAEPEVTHPRLTVVAPKAAGKSPTVEQYFRREWWPIFKPENPNTARSRMASWENHILPVIGRHMLAELDLLTIKEMIDGWTCAKSTRSVRMRETITPFMAYACDKMERHNPMKDLPRPSKAQRVNDLGAPPEYPLTLAEVTHIVRTIHPRFRVMAIVAMATGMRIGELRGLRWSRIRWVADGVEFNVTSQLGRGDDGKGRAGRAPEYIPPKGGESRKFIGPVWLREELEWHRERFASEKFSDLVFTNYYGNPLSRQAPIRVWLDMIKRWGKDPDIDGEQYRGWHQLRHYFGASQFADGVPPRQIQYQMGHSSLDITLRYYSRFDPAHEASDRARAAASARRPA
jgi:integrase